VASAQEASPPALWVISDEGSPPRALWGGNLTATHGIVAIGDVAVVGACGAGEEEEALLLSKEPREIVRVNLETGAVKERYANPSLCAMKQPEGLALFQRPASGAGVTTLVVVGEPGEVIFFDADPTSCSLSAGAGAAMNLVECPDPPDGSGCPLSIAEGGCPDRVCVPTPSSPPPIRVECAADDTDCGLGRCRTLCEIEPSLTCTHYSYAVSSDSGSAGACTLYEGCATAAEAPKTDEVVLYALSAASCARTLVQGGCPERRCSKTKNTHAKVCRGKAKKEPNPCMRRECERLCETHAEFQCSHFAFDEIDRDCYVFESCLDEGWSDDYTLAVRTQP